MHFRCTWGRRDDHWRSSLHDLSLHRKVSCPMCNSSAQDGYSAEPLSVKGEAPGTHCNDQPAGVGCF